MKRHLVKVFMLAGAAILALSDSAVANQGPSTRAGQHAAVAESSNQAAHENEAAAGVGMDPGPGVSDAAPTQDPPASASPVEREAAPPDGEQTPPPAAIRPSVALNLKVLKSLKAPVGFPKAPTERLWERDYLTGNWGGSRDEWHDKGLEFALAYFLDYFGNVSGGLEEGATLRHVSTISFDLHSRRDGFWKAREGQMLHITSGDLRGPPLREKVGSLNPTSYSDAVPSFRLFEAWYGVKFDNNTKELRIGKILPYVMIAASRSAGILENASFQYPNFLGFGAGGTYLATPFGVQFRATRGRYTLITQVQDGYDDPSGGFDNRHGVKIGFSRDEGVEGTVELAYRRHQLPGDTGLPGTYRFGGQFHTGVFEHRSIDAEGRSLALAGGDPRQSRGNYGLYVVHEQMLWREGTDLLRRRQGVTAFWKGVVLPRDGYNTVGWNVAAGLYSEGLIPGRDRDTLALGISYTPITESVRQLARDRRTLDPTVIVPDAERVVELQYGFQFTPWWAWKLHVQRIIHPNGSSGIPSSTVLGSSFRVGF